jgi:hypothetical protein
MAVPMLCGSEPAMPLHSTRLLSRGRAFDTLAFERTSSDDIEHVFETIFRQQSEHAKTSAFDSKSSEKTSVFDSKSSGPEASLPLSPRAKTHTLSLTLGPARSSSARIPPIRPTAGPHSSPAPAPAPAGGSAASQPRAVSSAAISADRRRTSALPPFFTTGQNLLTIGGQFF